MNNFGIGVDIENINRFSELDYVKDRNFLKRVFTDKELKYCFSKSNSGSHLAVRYAGKEAVVKALGSMGKDNIDYRDIEITNIKNGAPFVSIRNPNFNNLKPFLSLSHCEDKAIAFVFMM